MSLLRCIECGKPGHLKCTKEKISEKIPIDALVKDDLNEFISKFTVKTIEKKMPAAQYLGASDDSDEPLDIKDRDLRESFDYVDEIKEIALQQTDKHKLNKTDSWVKNSTNLHVPESSYMTALRKAQTIYGIPKNHSHKDLYCCICGGKHSDEVCNLRFNRQSS
jgi:hypothetical protein